MSLGDVVDEFHDERGLANARPSKQADLAASRIGCQKVDHLDAGLEKLGHGGEACEGRRVAVDLRQRGFDGPQLVDGTAQHVDHAAEHRLAHRHADAAPRISHGGAAAHAVGGLQRDAAHHAGRGVCRNLHVFAVGADEQIAHLGRLALKLHVEHGAANLDDDPLVCPIPHSCVPPCESASAAPVISEISLVMALCRAM